MRKMDEASRTLRIFAVVLLLAVSAQGGNFVESPPLIDLDTSYLSNEIQIPWAGDPFRKKPGYAKVDKKEPSFVLSGIVYSNKEPIAVINGESVMIGDEIDGRVVHSIGKNYVILRKGDSLQEVVLPPAETEEDEP